MRVASREAQNDVVPAAANGSWRNWLVTGARREPIARRRVQGAHKELKRLLVEGMNEGGDRTHSWKSFSGAMARQAVEEAAASLPPQQKQLIKLAYFSNLSNREIAQGLGITLSSVERGLREAIARVSAYVEHGRAAGRRVTYGLALFLGGRWLTDTAHQAAGPSTGQLVRVGAFAVAAATAGAVLISQPVSPGQLSTIGSGGAPAISASQPFAIMQRQAIDMPKVTAAFVERTISQAESQEANAEGTQGCGAQDCVAGVDGSGHNATGGNASGPGRGANGSGGASPASGTTNHSAGVGRVGHQAVNGRHQVSAAGDQVG